MWIQPLLLTLQLMTVSVIIAAVIGVVAAWAASSLASNGRWGRLVCRVFLAAMLVAIAMPLILHAAAWEATAGKFGWMIMTQTGAQAAGSGPFGFFGGLLACGWVHGLVGAALVALATSYGAGNAPAVLIQQSRLEMGPIEAWWRIRLPLASPWLIAAMLATAALAATEMTVVNLYGLRTLADEFYTTYAVNPSVASVLMTSFLPLAIAGVLISWLLIIRRRLLVTQRDREPTPTSDERLTRPWETVFTAIIVTVTGVIVVVPLLGLLVKLGHEVTVDNGIVRASWSLSACLQRLLAAPQDFSQEYQWTAIVAALTAAAALTIAWPLSAIGRIHRSAGQCLDLATIVMVAIPGPIVGLATVSVFQSNVPGFHTLYQQSLVPTMLALLVRSGPVAYWVLRSGYRGIDTAIFESARLECSWLQRMWLIDRPLLKSNLIAAALAAAIVASGDVPATLPVIPPGVTTVGTRLFGLLHSGARYQEAGLAIWYVAAVVAICLIWLRQASRSRVTMF